MGFVHLALQNLSAATITGVNFPKMSDAPGAWDDDVGRDLGCLCHDYNINSANSSPEADP